MRVEIKVITKKRGDEIVAVIIASLHAHGQRMARGITRSLQQFAALGGVERNHMIARLDVNHPLTHLHNDACAFMTQQDR